MNPAIGPQRRRTVSAATRCGPHHASNQDSYGRMEAADLFVVADGVGGSTDGDLASAAVVGVLNEAVEPGQDLETRVQLAEDALRSVSAALSRAGRDRAAPTVIATTVVALLIDEGLAVCLWAGDSRLYLFRDGHLYRLTQDHTLENEFGTTGPARGRLTRAVGSSRALDLERIVTATRPGDVFLLCSDGITKVIDDDELARFLAEPAEGLAPRLIERVAVGAGGDDATAIVVRLGEDR
jgi:serine/threonine protein phosphatase PrpC